MRDRPIPLSLNGDRLRASALNSFVRAAIAAGLSVLDGTSAADRALRTWPDDRDAQLLLRMAAPPLTTTDAAALSTVAVALLETLKPLAAGPALLSRGLQLSFDGAGAISVPTFAPGASDFVGEGMPIPFKQFPLTAPLLSPFKFATLVGLSEEMLSYSNAESIVRTALVESVALGLDKALFSSAAGVEDLRPPGLLFNVPSVPAAAAGGGKTDTMLEDLCAICAAVAPVAGLDGIAIVAAPPQAVAISLRLLRPPALLFASAALADGVVIAVAANALVSAVEQPRVDAGTQVTPHEETMPAPVVDDSGVAAAPVRSFFQADALALRLRMPLSWALRAPNSVAWVEGVSW